MKKNTILIFIDWYKPGYKAGGPIRSVSNMVDALKDHFQFYIVTRNTDYLETTPYSNINTNQWNNIDNAQVFYLSKENTKRSTIHVLIDEVQPDIVYCNSFYSPYFSLIPIHYAKKKKIKTILAVRGMLSKGSLNVKKAKKRTFINFIKWVGLFKKITFHATTNEEKQDIENTFGKQPTVIVANNLPEQKTYSFIEKRKTENSILLVSVARIAPEKNTLYAIEALKNCKSKVNFDIFGPIYNQEYWSKCLKSINELPVNVNVNYKGALPHDEIDTTLQQYHALFLPSTGENFGHIIIEAMANACVPIISDKTPWRNLATENVGFDINLANLKQFTTTIDKLASIDETTFNEMARNAFLYAQQVTNNQLLIEQYKQLFQL
ncbi:MAG: glycosyltransferase [Flavobacteriales bacterium]|jgi:glycosyltransferase involved in cell wall biosynthesis|nr:glycosyltransferase [Flavobacteriales bacterium]MCW8937684.1 glycosyltransferase [Flavobacteriales bacterium]MCW8940570.1 glycosyltransferase [Flavobacteriales bacterium]MCW8990172.1 glycosyltransferase [Flavobacteriales bacterium]MCW9019890.1 glycosyltransferase [Flavobacteriales bacterium]